MMERSAHADTLFDQAEPAAAGGGIADVLVPLALDTAYSYRVPAGMTLAPGDVVAVPLGPRERHGVVWAVSPGAGANLKAVSARLDAPALPGPLRALIDWIARYTLVPRGLVLRLALRDPGAVAPEVPRVGVRPTGSAPRRATPARTRVLAALAAMAADAPPCTKRQLADAASVSTGVIDGLVDEGVLQAVMLEPEAHALPDPAFAPARLSEDQAAAAARLREGLAGGGEAGGGGFGVTLIEGVTGSGKTEVYFEAVAEVLRQGRQVLILMPEIALTTQFLDRFARRFGVPPAEWHSGVTGRRRERVHLGVASGEVKVVTGARSALFLPYADLGLIIIDEEHEAAYKQEEGVHYHARDMAVVRGRIENIPVLLASATPSIETRVNAERGRYGKLVLPRRFGERTMPSLAAIDLRRHAPEKGRWISPPLGRAVAATLERGEQAMFFLNRRGYAPLTLCRACGHRFQCPNCAASLVEHRFRRALVCHHCGHTERRPDACPACGAADALVPAGPGVERLAEEVAGLFPQARLIVLSSDFPGGSERMRRELEAVAAGECDIVIGTQLVAKGHNFPHLTLVGVVDADVGLVSGDPRGSERTFQLLQQVTGRAGRGDKPGAALLQTHQPEHPVIAALLSGEAERFYAEETAAREAAGLPPFGRLASLIVSAPLREEAEAHARAIVRAAMECEREMRAAAADLIVLGPAEAPLALLRGMHRFRILVKTSRSTDMQGFLRAVLARAPRPPARLRVTVDVDPQSFM